MRRVINIGAVLLLLLVLPLGSYIYLKKGFDKRVDLIGSLDSLGKYSQLDGFQDVYTLVDSVVVIATFANVESQQLVHRNVKRLHKQFKSNEGVHYLIHLVQNDDMDYYAFNQLDSIEQIHVLRLSERTHPMAVAKGFHMDVDNPYDQICLVDRNGIVRVHTSMTDSVNMKTFVKQLGVLLPKRKRKKIDLKREIEK